MEICQEGTHNIAERLKSSFSGKERLANTGKAYGKYRYKVFGLHVESDILLPELLTSADNSNPPEVTIILGEVPDDIIDPIEKSQSYQAAKNRFIFNVPKVGRYYVTNGNCILVQPAEQVEERVVRLFLLGTTFGVLLMQRGIVPIHGSAVVINGYCVILTGVSGAGKSTLLAALREQGYSFLTDDVAAVTVGEDGVAWVHSAYPQQKLWRDSAENLGINVASLATVNINVDKFAVPVHKGFRQSPAQLVAVYELGVERCRNVTVNPLSGMDKLAVLMSHTYRSWLTDGLGFKAQHFIQCVAIARQVAVSRLIRPEGVYSLEEQVRIIQYDLSQLFADRLSIQKV